MGLDEAMIVAGVGCRAGAGMADVLAAIEAALIRDRVDRLSLFALATDRRRSAEEGLAAAGNRLALPVMVVEPADLEAAAGRAITRSERVETALGLPSLSECAALAAAGPNSRLLGPRVAVGSVTCAIAIAGDRE